MVTMSPGTAPSGGEISSTTVLSALDAHMTIPFDMIPRSLFGFRLANTTHSELRRRSSVMNLTSPLTISGRRFAQVDLLDVERVGIGMLAHVNDPPDAEFQLFELGTFVSADGRGGFALRFRGRCLGRSGGAPRCGVHAGPRVRRVAVRDLGRPRDITRRRQFVVERPACGRCRCLRTGGGGPARPDVDGLDTGDDPVQRVQCSGGLDRHGSRAL